MKKMQISQNYLITDKAVKMREEKQYFLGVIFFLWRAGDGIVYTFFF